MSYKSSSYVDCSCLDFCTSGTSTTISPKSCQVIQTSYFLSFIFPCVLRKASYVDSSCPTLCLKVGCFTVKHATLAANTCYCHDYTVFYIIVITIHYVYYGDTACCRGHEDLPLSKQTKPESSTTHIPHPPPALPPSIPAPPAPSSQAPISRSAEGPPQAASKPAVPGWKRGSRLAAAPSRSASYQNPGPKPSGGSGNVVKSQDLDLHKSTASEQLQGSHDLTAHAGQGPLAAGKPAQALQLGRSQESNPVPLHGPLEGDTTGRGTYSRPAWQSQEAEVGKSQSREGPKGEGRLESGLGESVERVQRAGHSGPSSKGGNKSEVPRALTPELDPRVAALLNDPEAAFVGMTCHHFVLI